MPKLMDMTHIIPMQPNTLLSETGMVISNAPVPWYHLNYAWALLGQLSQAQSMPEKIINN